MRTKRIHMDVSVRGLLRNHPNLTGVLRDDEGFTLSHQEARDALFDCLKEGKECLPLCAAEECPDFDYTGGGCPGHKAPARNDHS